jgi:hypothetical protein
MRIGSEEHKELFCRYFLDTHEAYEPKDLPWPDLDDGALARLRSIPFWSIALQTERDAGLMLDGYAITEGDPLVRRAIALQAYEEARHFRMLSTLVDRYGLSGEVEENEPIPTRRRFITFGYQECIDSFVGFGAFRLAREARFLPDALVRLFARVLEEEARHIVFFVNWVAYDRAKRGRGMAPLRVPAEFMGYMRALFAHFGMGKGVKNAPKMQVSEEVFGEFSLSKFLSACVAENTDVMAVFDKRLLQPRVMPAIGRFALGVARPIERMRGSKRAAAPTEKAGSKPA